MAGVSTYRRGALLVGGAMLAWSSAGLLARLVATDPWTTLFWRSVYALGALLLFLGWREGRGMAAGFRALGRTGWAMAACFAVSMICFINALALTSVAAVLVFQAVAPMFAAVLGWVVLREAVSREKLLAVAVCLGAVLFITAGADAGRMLGNLLSAGMGLTYAGTVVLARRGGDVRTTEATTLGVGLVILVSLPFARLEVSGGEMALLAGFGVVQMGLALVMFTAGVKLIPAVDAGLISVLEAVLAPLWVWLLLGEDPGWRTLAGGAVVLAAVAATAVREGLRREAAVI